MAASAAATRSRSFARSISSKAALYCGSHSGNLKLTFIVVSLIGRFRTAALHPAQFMVCHPKQKSLPPTSEHRRCGGVSQHTKFRVTYPEGLLSEPYFRCPSSCFRKHWGISGFPVLVIHRGQSHSHTSPVDLPYGG